MHPPSLSDVYAARERISLHLRPTPLMSHPLLNEETGLDIWVKHENHNPTGAFKVRGGLNLVSSLTPDERARGVVTASTGNHGQSIIGRGLRRRHRDACHLRPHVRHPPAVPGRLRAPVGGGSRGRCAAGPARDAQPCRRRGRSRARGGKHLSERFQGLKVVAVMSGGNLHTERPRWILSTA